MLVIDENLHDQRIMAAISTWYPGQVPLLSRTHSLRVPLGSPPFGFLPFGFLPFGFLQGMQGMQGRQGMHAGVVGGGIRRSVA